MPSTDGQGWQQFAAMAADRHNAPMGDYSALWQWSVDHPARFWRAVWEYFDIRVMAPTNSNRLLPLNFFGGRTLTATASFMKEIL